MVPAEITGPDIMYALVLEDGKMWGEVAADFQVADVEAIFSPERPNWHFLTRGRGGSKSSDIAGLCLSWLYADSRTRARGYVVASNVEQAGILIDAAAGFVARSPVLEDRLKVESERLLNTENGAWIRVLPLSDSGAWGLRDTHFLICDEFAQWPETRGAKRVYSAIRSTVQKTPGCRLILLTSAGEPSHWSKPVLDKAYADPANWRVNEVPGPVPWQSEEDLAALQRELTPSEYERLVLNRWASADDRAISEDDYERAIEREGLVWGHAPVGVKGGGLRLRHPRVGTRYILTVDVGVANDATVIAVSHKEPIDPNERRSPNRVVLDHIDRWQGSKRRRIEVDAVRARVAELAKEYNGASVYGDPDQFVGSLQQLRRHGVRASEWAFTATSVGQVATALVQVFANGQIASRTAPSCARSCFGCGCARTRRASRASTTTRAPTTTRRSASGWRATSSSGTRSPAPRSGSTPSERPRRSSPGAALSRVRARCERPA